MLAGVHTQLRASSLLAFATGAMAAAGLVAAVYAMALGGRPELPPASYAAVAPAGEPPPRTSSHSRGESEQSWTIVLDGWHVRVGATQVPLPRVEDLWAATRSSNAEELGLSPYDRWIVSYAQEAGLDWELVAAVIAEESGFDASAVSDRGAVGLMQVRPVAAAQVGEENFADPESNIRTGVRYLRYLHSIFTDVVPAERLAFVLAAYNMGPLHVRDAQQLAQQLGFDPRRWHGHVERVLPLLEMESFYRHLAGGFARGKTTQAYVRRVLERYEALVRRPPAG